MAIAFRSTTSVAYGSRTNLTINAPAGAANGSDVILVAISVGQSSSTTASAPGGFTQASTVQYSKPDPWTENVYLFWRIHDGSANWTFTHASASSSAVALAYSGVDNTTPIDVAAVTNTGAGTNNASLSSINIATAGALRIGVRGSWDGNAISPPASWTERHDAAILWVGEIAAAGTGATGATTVDAGNGQADNTWGTIHTALRPSGGTSVSDPGRIKKLNYGALLQL